MNFEHFETYIAHLMWEDKRTFQIHKGDYRKIEFGQDIKIEIDLNRRDERAHQWIKVLFDYIDVCYESNEISMKDYQNQGLNSVTLIYC